jgi:hypothetical protein
VVNPAQQLQVCPLCEGTGEEPMVERYFAYLAQVALLANQVLLNQRIVTNGDFDFRVKLLTSDQTGAFRIRIHNNEGQYYSSAGEGGVNDRVRNACLFGTGSLPFIVVPHIEIPRSGAISFDLEDISAAPNVVHLVFHGAKLSPPAVTS